MGVAGGDVLGSADGGNGAVGRLVPAKPAPTWRGSYVPDVMGRRGILASGGGLRRDILGARGSGSSIRDYLSDRMRGARSICGSATRLDNGGGSIILHKSGGGRDSGEGQRRAERHTDSARARQAKDSWHAKLPPATMLVLINDEDRHNNHFNNPG
jgi:hypothetical protein